MIKNFATILQILIAIIGLSFLINGLVKEDFAYIFAGLLILFVAILTIIALEYDDE